MEGLELASFQIISAVGTARADYIEAIRTARNGEFEKAKKLVEEGREAYKEGHEVHFKLIQEEADGKSAQYSMLMTHAEDQLMSAEAFGILAEEFIETYKMIYAKSDDKE